MHTNLTHLSQVFSQITDPRSKHGTYQPSAGILALTFLGLLAGQNYFTHICRWAKNHWKILKEPLGFKTKKPPDRTTISRLLAQISLTEIQEAFSTFLSQLLQETSLTAAVDGKVSQQILDEEQTEWQHSVPYSTPTNGNTAGKNTTKIGCTRHR